MAIHGPAITATLAAVEVAKEYVKKRLLRAKVCLQVQSNQQPGYTCDQDSPRGNHNHEKVLTSSKLQAIGKCCHPTRASTAVTRGSEAVTQIRGEEECSRKPSEVRPKHPNGPGQEALDLMQAQGR